jgi:hypothetical protein
MRTGVAYDIVGDGSRIGEYLGHQDIVCKPIKFDAPPWFTF